MGKKIRNNSLFLFHPSTPRSLLSYNCLARKGTKLIFKWYFRNWMFKQHIITRWFGYLSIRSHHHLHCLSIMYRLPEHLHMYSFEFTWSISLFYVNWYFLWCWMDNNNNMMLLLLLNFHFLYSPHKSWPTMIAWAWCDDNAVDDYVRQIYKESECISCRLTSELIYLIRGN